MHLVKSISKEISQQVIPQTEELGDSGQRPRLFPNMKDYLKEDSNLIIIDDGANSNIRAFYVAMLQYIVQGMGHYSPEIRVKSFKVLNEMKSHLYRKNTVLTCIKNTPDLRVQNDPRKNTAFTSLEMKKLLGEFFHLLTEGSDSKNKVERIFEKYSFIPTLMNIYIRSLLWLQYDLASASDYTKHIDDESVFNCLSGLIGLEEFSYSNDLVTCFECKIFISIVNLIGHTIPKPSPDLRTIYLLYYPKDLFKDITFSEQPHVRFRAQTQQTNSENEAEARQQHSYSSFNNAFGMKRYDSFQEELHYNGDPASMPEGHSKNKYTFQKYRPSVEDTYQSEKNPHK